MNQINALVKLNPGRLNFPATMIYARQLRSAVVSFCGVPTDVSSASVRIFKTDGAQHFDIPMTIAGDGTGECYIVGTAFPDVGVVKYEVSATDANGNPTALGAGHVTIEAFSAASTPVTPGQPTVIAEIPDSTGVMHTINAVQNSSGEFTIVLDATQAVATISPVSAAITQN